MAARLDAESDARFGELVRRRFFESAHARVPRVESWDEARKSYDPSHIDRKKVKTPPYVKVPYVYRTVNTQVSQLLSASESNGSWFKVRSSTPEHGDLGDVVGVLLDNQMLQKQPEVGSDNTEAMERAARMGDIYGCAFVHLSYREWPGGWCVRAENLSCRDVFADWIGTRWFIVRRWMTLSELRDWSAGIGAATAQTLTDPATGDTFEVDGPPRDGGRAAKAWKELMAQVESGRALNRSALGFLDSSSWENTADMGRVAETGEGGGDGSVAPKDDPYNARIEVLQYHETARDGIVGVIVPGMGKDMKDLVFQKETSPYKCCTVVHYCPDPLDNDLYGFGVAETVGPLQEVMSYNLRSHLRIVAKNSDAPMLVPKALNLPRHFIDSPGGKNIEVSGDPRLVTYLASGVDGGAHHFALQASKMVADMTSGMSDQRRGQAGGASSATEAAIAEAAGNATDRLRFRRWKRFVEQVGHVMLAVLKVHVTNRRVIPALGRDAGRFVEVRPEWLEGSFEVQFAGSAAGMNPAQEASAWQGFATAFGPAGVVDMAAVARRVAMRLGERDPDSLMLAKSGRPRLSAQYENEGALKWGHRPSVHPADDDMGHARSHFQSAQGAPPGHPGAALLMEHVQEHLAAAQMKAAQAGGIPNVGMGAPAPMSSGEAGAFTPSTEAAARSRQDSNRDAFGMSPGGVAAGRTPGSVVRNGSLVR